MDTLSEVTGSNFVKIVLPPFWSGICSKRKEFTPKWSKFFLFQEDPFQRELDVYESKQEVRERKQEVHESKQEVMEIVSLVK